MSAVTSSWKTGLDSPLHAKALSLHVIFMLLPMLTGEGRAEHGRILKEVAALCDAG
ncbi:TPA: hypothetical protein ACOJQA_000585 [Pseudomonas putida]|uniref:hypothetical protein n=1 Tax=Diaphorobacter sp. ED-3 TaxID=3016636 RepID=UPI0000DCCD66|nr:hypothetical protein [Diaphorobacter sp. ED-3]